MHREVLGSRDKKHVWLFHGSAAPPSSLSALAVELAETFRVHVPHFPGYGDTPYSSHDTLTHSIKHIAATITQIDEPVVLVGHSFGLYRAIRLLEVIDRRLITGLYGLSGHATLPEEQREEFKQAEAWARSGEQIASGLAARWFSSRHLDAHPEIIGHVEHWWSECHIEAVARELYEPFDGGRADRILAESSQPTLLRAGTLDVAVPVERCAAMVSLRQDITVELVEDTGHFLHIENSSATLASIVSFVSACK